MIVYSKLAKILEERNMQWKDLTKAGISVNMPTKFSNNRNMNTENIDKICEYLHVQPGDIMSWIPDKEYTEESAERKKLESEMAAIQAKLKELEGK